MDDAQSIKYIVILGSGVSGLGKGVVTASIGAIIQSSGIRVTPIKLDGYLNVDCGTMSPYEHGEVFVLNDGSEVDLDFGTYERFLNTYLTGSSSLTGGKLFYNILQKERSGQYMGDKVTIHPHVVDAVQDWVIKTGKDTGANVVLVEVGGTVGDIENRYFIDAMQKLSLSESILFIQLVPLFRIQEGYQDIKTIQTEHRKLLSFGIIPAVMLIRSDEQITVENKRRIANSCNLPENAIITDPSLDTPYLLPDTLKNAGICTHLTRFLGHEISGGENLDALIRIARIICQPEITHKIAVVGKYTTIKDSYLSVVEAMRHAAAYNGHAVHTDLLESAMFEDDTNALNQLLGYDGIIVPGGYGMRGVEGMINATRFARENHIPYLGLCLGLHIMTIEYARNMCGLNDANSTEMNPETPFPVINYVPGQADGANMGASNRLGSYPGILIENTIAMDSYGNGSVHERHRHRRRVNLEFIDVLTQRGLVVSGWDPDKKIVEIMEWPDHFGFGVSTQAHLELKSRPLAPSPLFVAFDLAAEMNKTGSGVDYIGDLRRVLRRKSHSDRSQNKKPTKQRT